MGMYRKKQLIEALSGIIEIKEPTIAYYLNLKIVTPDVANPSGSTEIKYYSSENLVDVAIARTLELHGLKLKAIAGIMKSIRKEVRANFRKIKDDYRFHLVISNPNQDDSKTYLQMCLLKKFQKVNNPVDPAVVKLNMDHAKCYMVVDLSQLLSRLARCL